MVQDKDEEVNYSYGLCFPCKELGWDGGGEGVKHGKGVIVRIGGERIKPG